MDLYLRAADEATMNAELLAAGLIIEQDGGLAPAPGVNLDVIGPITKWDYTVDPPVETIYPEWHVNVRSYDLTDEQLAGLADVMIIPPELPFRVWA